MPAPSKRMPPRLCRTRGEGSWCHLLLQRAECSCLIDGITVCAGLLTSQAILQRLPAQAFLGAEAEVYACLSARTHRRLSAKGTRTPSSGKELLMIIRDFRRFSRLFKKRIVLSHTFPFTPAQRQMLKPTVQIRPDSTPFAKSQPKTHTGRKQP